MDPIAKLRIAILEQIKANVPVQLVWATCKETNMEQGTMTAMRDDIEYHDVLLGLGADLVEPEADSKVLLLLIENKRAATVLLYAESVSRRYINGDSKGGLVIADKVVDRLNLIEQSINDLKMVLSAWTPVSMDGGAALKAAAATWFAVQLQQSTSEPLQNTTVSHGD